MGFGLRTDQENEEVRGEPGGQPATQSRYVRAVLERPTAERIEGTFETPYGKLTVSVYTHGEYHVYLSAVEAVAELDDAVLMGQMFRDGSLQAVPRGVAVRAERDENSERNNAEERQ